jgi:hypothetical protein
MSFSCGWKKAAGVCAVALALLLGTVSLVWAQGAGSASITGTVKDPKGLLVPDAEVVVHNADTGADRNLTTNKDGLYVAPLLQPGHYEVRVRKEGFAEVVRKDLLLEVGQALTVDIDLPLKATQQTVTVTAEAGRVETEKFDVSQTIAQYQVENLPLNGRNWTNFVLLTPGVSEDGGFGLVSFRGVSALYNNNMVDGADNNQAFFSEARGRTRLPYVYSLDAIKEFNVETGTYSAEYGRAAGGIVNAVTKSGTNSFHGDAFYFIRDDLWLARDPIANAGGQPKPDERRQQFGGSFGGPVVPEKVFFFLSYDQQKRNFPAIVTGSQPSTFTKQLATCTSDTTVTVAECTSIFNAINSVANATDPRKGNNYIGLGKMDYQVNPSNRISGVVNVLRWDSPNGIQTGPVINVSHLANGTDGVHDQFVTGSWNSVITPSVVNEVRFQYGEDFEFQSANQSGPSFGFGSPSIGAADFGMPNFLPRGKFPDEFRYQWVDNLSWVRGRHQFKTGLDINRVHDDIQNLFQGGGVYNYPTGSALDLLVRDIFNGTRSYTTFVQAVDPITGSGKGSFTTNDYNFYFQDNVKLRPSFTLYMGLRYELQTMPEIPEITRANPLVPESRKLNTDLNNFGPRVGFAWDIGGRQKHVIRSGYGIYYGRTQNSTLFTHLFQNGIFQQTFSINPRAPAIAANLAACAPLVPNTLFPQPGTAPAFGPIFGSSGPTPTAMYPTRAAFQAACPQGIAGLTVDVLDPHFVNPLVHEYDVTYEQAMPWGLSLSASYLGSRANHLPIFYDVNLPPPDTTKTYLVFDKNGNPIGPTQFTVPFFSGIPAVPGTFYRPRINPATGRPLGTVLMGKSIVNSWYNALVVRLRRREIHGFSFDANFTYSKSIDDGQVMGTNGTFTGTDSPLNPFDIRAEYGPSELDIRKRFVMNFYWVAPFANWTQNQAAKAIIGGWKFSSVIRAQDGRPVIAFMGGSPSCRSGDFGFTCGTVSANAGFTNGRVPFMERNGGGFLTPGLFTVDLRVNREFKFTERASFEMFAEAFNLFNRTNGLTVNNTAFNFASPSPEPTARVPNPPRTFCPRRSDLSTTIPNFNGCVQQSAPFLTVRTTSNTLYTARQLQIGGRFRF